MKKVKTTPKLFSSVTTIYLVTLQINGGVTLSRACRLKQNAVRYANAKNKASTYPIKAYFVEELELHD